MEAPAVALELEFRSSVTWRVFTGVRPWAVHRLRKHRRLPFGNFSWRRSAGWFGHVRMSCRVQALIRPGRPDEAQQLALKLLSQAQAQVWHAS